MKRFLVLALVLAACGSGSAPVTGIAADGQALFEQRVLADNAGCVTCHVPSGASCSAQKAGAYRFKTKRDRLCLMCHERGTGTQHTRAGSKCLSCHSPHGSDGGNTLMRAG